MKKIANRVGFGFDVHRFSGQGRGFFLGGAWIPADFGIEAVSDGDVLLHAVSDGICGACGLGDIGDHFPPSAERSKDISSKKIVEDIVKKADGFSLINMDITIVSEKPKLAPYKENILGSLRELFPGCAINVKVKSKEGLSFLGGEDSLFCFAVVLAEKI